MREIVFFLEERSAEEMLKAVLPKVLPETVVPRFVVFEGKQDLEGQLPRKLRAWRHPHVLFVVMRDQDSGDCVTIKNALVQKCADAGKPETLVRIACRELESFYLGDLQAVSDAIGPANIASYQNKAKYRDPDTLANPFQELKRLAPSYQKVSGSRAIGRCLNLENNRSKSFNILISGIQSLVGNIKGY